MMLIKTIYEFLVWDNCSNSCKFCFQRQNPRLFSLDQQKHNLDQVLDFLNSSDFVPSSHVLIVGGELFDDPKRSSFLVSFFYELCILIEKGIIDLLYVNTNLIYDDASFEMLKSIINLFNDKNILSHLKFTTSYDINGRFDTETKHRMFLTNLTKLKDTYSNLNVVTNMILSNDLCNSICNNSFDIFRFSDRYQTDINLIPYIILDNSLVANKCLVFKTINLLYEMNSGFIDRWIAELDLKQPRKMFYTKCPSSELIGCECGLSECGHSVNFKRYSSNGSCFVCDIKKLYAMIKND